MSAGNYDLVDNVGGGIALVVLGGAVAAGIVVAGAVVVTGVAAYAAAVAGYKAATYAGARVHEMYEAAIEAIEIDKRKTHERRVEIEKELNNIKKEKLKEFNSKVSADEATSKVYVDKILENNLVDYDNVGISKEEIKNIVSKMKTNEIKHYIDSLVFLSNEISRFENFLDKFVETNKEEDLDLNKLLETFEDKIESFKADKSSNSASVEEKTIEVKKFIDNIKNLIKDSSKINKKDIEVLNIELISDFKVPYTLIFDKELRDLFAKDEKEEFAKIEVNDVKKQVLYFEELFLELYGADSREYSEIKLSLEYIWEILNSNKSDLYKLENVSERIDLLKMRYADDSKKKEKILALIKDRQDLMITNRTYRILINKRVEAKFKLPILDYGSLSGIEEEVKSLIEDNNKLVSRMNNILRKEDFIHKYKKTMSRFTNYTFLEEKKTTMLNGSTVDILYYTTEKGNILEVTMDEKGNKKETVSGVANIGVAQNVTELVKDQEKFCEVLPLINKGLSSDYKLVNKELIQASSEFAHHIDFNATLKQDSIRKIKQIKSKRKFNESLKEKAL
jgi:hypothetical protein